jgi:hypothetical protein
MRWLRAGLCALGALAICACAAGETQAQNATSHAQTVSVDPYAPYEFLIGEWDTTGSGSGAAVAVQRFRWGPRRGYILYSTSTLDSDGEERLHFEGVILYNAASRSMDFLIALEPGSLSQERGTLKIEADGSITRDVTLIAANGTISRHRQTFRASGPNSAFTTLMRQTTDGGWAPNFPGSDHLDMRRRTHG